MGGDKTDFEGCITHGPWGGSKGKSWIYMPKSFIKKIVILHGNFINGIKFYSVETESSHIGSKCDTADEIFINYPNEYLTSISGRFGGINEGSVILCSLSFGTNHNHYGPYGYNVGGTPFSFEGKGVMIVGFHGRVSPSLKNAYGSYSQYLEAIGIYVMPESFASTLNSTSADKSIHELCSEMSRMSMPRDAGPWGASVGGQPWDDGVFVSVKKVHVHIIESLNVICAIQFEYVESNAKSILSPMHGGTGGDKIELVNLDDTDEYLIGISGFYGPIKGYNGLEAITSITFHTNKKKHGPFGEENGAGYTCFSSTASSGKVVGFHGRNDGFFKAIGVHMKYF